MLIPSNVTSIGTGAFGFSARLTGIEVDPLNPAYSSLDGVLFNKGRTTLVGYPTGRVGGYAIPDSVTTIGRGAFAGATSLPSVTIPERVSSIENSAFSSCTSVSNLAIPSSVTNIGSFAFESCTSLTGITIPDRVPRIAYYTFHACTALTNIAFGQSLTNIGMSAFQSCTNLTNVTIPDSVTRIGGLAFIMCYNLTTVIIGRGVAHLGDLAFSGTSLTGVFFWGNAPPPECCPFERVSATAYYLSGTTGWGPMVEGVPTAPWVLREPLILTTPPDFGVGTNGYGFVISWATNAAVVVEACTDLGLPDWSPVGTNTLNEGWSYFSDPEWTNYASRFYRLRSP